MKTTQNSAVTASSAGQTRRLDLQAMLHDRERGLQDALQRRLRCVPSHRPGDGFDDTEQAEADVQEHVAVALIQIEGETLRRIREALARLDADEYGYCADCDGEISEQRLRALPFAVRCTACEGLHEQRADRERRSASLQGFRSIFADRVGP